MLLIVGLGNPGSAYNKTPHNAGFAAIDFLLSQLDPSIHFSENKKFKADVATLHHGGQKIILAKPSTFMNLSGQSVKSLAQYYKTDIEDIYILHDDIDIVAGTIKIAKNRGAAGHNGIKSIIENLNTKDFNRIRIGVKFPKEIEIPIEKYVLQRLNEADLAIIQEGIEQASKELLNILK